MLSLASIQFPNTFTKFIFALLNLNFCFPLPLSPLLRSRLRCCSITLLLPLIDPPPTGLLAASTAPPPRQAVFNPYDIPVSPPPGPARPQPQHQPGLLWLHWMICLAAWITESLCSHPIMAEAVPPDQYFETISPRNIYIQMRRAIHEFNILQRRIARGVSLLQFVVPPTVPSTTHGQYRVHPNGFIRALGAPEENYNLGTTADDALLSRRQPHRNFDSSTPPESSPTPATPATPPPATTPTPTCSRSHTPPPVNILPPLPGSSTSTMDNLLSWLDDLHLIFHLGSLSSGRGILRGHLWQATRFRTTTPLPNPLITNEGSSPPPPEPTS